MIAQGQHGGVDFVERATQPLEPSCLLSACGNKKTMASHVGVLMAETAATN
jgi:hypothetical protein